MKLQPLLLKLLCKTGIYASNRIQICLPRKLLGAWCYNCSCLHGRQLKNTCKTYLGLMNHLKFDESDPILGSNHGELSCIFALITGDNVQFDMCADHAPSSLAILEIALTLIRGSTKLLKPLVYFILASSATKNSSTLLTMIVTFSW